MPTVGAPTGGPLTGAAPAGGASIPDALAGGPPTGRKLVGGPSAGRVSGRDSRSAAAARSASSRSSGPIC
ncbi:hypothetical protein COO58_19585 [Micromonospora sp. WMMA1996]|nr:hypothetical protein COO58_19585 [Micromonospora sp. WMMA1996]